MLTYAQRRVYDALVELTQDGWPATVREVQRAVGLASPSSAYEHLRILAVRGFARQHPRNEKGGWLPATPALGPS